MIETITDPDRIDDYKEQWDTLYQASGMDNVFLTATWIQCWMRWFSNGEHVVLLNISNGQMISAGVFRRHPGIRSFIDANHSYYPSILALPEETKALAPYLHLFHSEGVHRILLNGITDSSVFHQRLEDQARGHYYVIRRNPHCLRSIEIRDSMEAYLTSRPSKVRAELLRKRRKIQQMLPKLSLRVRACTDLTGEGETYERICKIEQTSWKSSAGTAIVSSEQERGFYRDILRLNESNIRGCAYILESCDIPVAHVIGVVHNRRFYALKTSYDKNRSALSPGQMLFFFVIESMSRPDHTIDSIELLGTDSRWKQELAALENRQCDVELLKKSAGSALYIYARNRLSPLLQSIIAKYPGILPIRNRISLMTNRIFKFLNS